MPGSWPQMAPDRAAGRLPLGWAVLDKTAAKVLFFIRSNATIGKNTETDAAGRPAILKQQMQRNGKSSGRPAQLRAAPARRVNEHPGAAN